MWSQVWRIRIVPSTVERIAEYYINCGSYMVTFGDLLPAKTERQMV